MYFLQIDVVKVVYYFKQVFHFLYNKKKIRLYFNNLLHIHQHTFLKYMIQSVIKGKNQKTNMSAYNIPL